MNYFSFYGLQPSFHLDLKSLRQLYYEKSKIYHPDSAAEVNSFNQDRDYFAALNNQAYKTLSNPLSRLHYILENEFPDTLPCPKEEDATFLMDMMELHEKLEDAIDTGDDQSILDAQQILESFEDNALEAASSSLSLFDQGERNQQIRCMLQRYAEQLKFFERLRQMIDTPGALPEL